MSEIASGAITTGIYGATLGLGAQGIGAGAVGAVASPVMLAGLLNDLGGQAMTENNVNAAMSARGIEPGTPEAASMKEAINSYRGPQEQKSTGMFGQLTSIGSTLGLDKIGDTIGGFFGADRETHSEMAASSNMEAYGSGQMSPEQMDAYEISQGVQTKSAVQHTLDAALTAMTPEQVASYESLFGSTFSNRRNRALYDQLAAAGMTVRDINEQEQEMSDDTSEAVAEAQTTGALPGITPTMGAISTLGQAQQKAQEQRNLESEAAISTTSTSGNWEPAVGGGYRDSVTGGIVSSDFAKTAGISGIREGGPYDGELEDAYGLTSRERADKEAAAKEAEEQAAAQAAAEAAAQAAAEAAAQSGPTYGSTRDLYGDRSGRDADVGGGSEGGVGQGGMDVGETGGTRGGR
jgi:hypothetical protein